MSDLATARMLVLYWTEEESKLYMRAYQSVMQQLESEKATSLLLSVVNTMLERMAKDGLEVHTASVAMIREMKAERSKFFVMAAAVDIALNDRKAGERVAVLPSMAETLAKL